MKTYAFCYWFVPHVPTLFYHANYLKYLLRSSGYIILAKNLNRYLRKTKPDYFYYCVESTQ